jgi:hypothetical protein
MTMTHAPRPQPQPVKGPVLPAAKQAAKSSTAGVTSAMPTYDPQDPGPTNEDAYGESTAIVSAAKPMLPAEMPADNRTSIEQYLDDIAPTMMVGRMIKFTKEGEFKTPDDDGVISPDIDFIVLADQTQVGWIHFNGEGNPPDREMGLLYDGFVMPKRETLGYTDTSEWEIGLKGLPDDPWKHQINLVLQQAGTAELFTFTTMNVTGQRAVGTLLKHFNRMQKTDPDMFPVVRLKVGGFNHRDQKIGWVSTPVFAIVGKHPKDSTAQPDTSMAADMSDTISF